MQTHYVIFYSFRQFSAKTNTIPIDKWSPAQAQRMARAMEREQPYAFQFVTRRREEGALKGEEAARSGMYYLRGTVQDLEAMKADDDLFYRAQQIEKEHPDADQAIYYDGAGAHQWTYPFYEDDTRLDVAEEVEMEGPKSKR